MDKVKENVFYEGELVEQINGLSRNDSKYVHVIKVNDFILWHNHKNEECSMNDSISHFRKIPIKVGDTVKCLKKSPRSSVGAGFKSEKEFVVARITCGNEEHPIYWDNNPWGVFGNELFLIKKGEPMSKYDEMKEKIEALDDGWNKDADDILKEIKMTYVINFSQDATSGCGAIEVYRRGYPEDKESFSYSTQCEKMQKFKKVLMHILNYSEIKKNEREEKIESLVQEIKLLSDKIKELKA